MTCYVAIVAIVNLALGYAIAVMLGKNRNRTALAAGHHEDGEPTEY